jgi:hypothetical protein
VRDDLPMAQLRFNHMELTFPPGTLTDEFRREVDAVFVDVLGWRAIDAEVVGQRTHILLPDDGQFILLAEGKQWMSSPGYDHLGFLLDTRDEVDDVLESLEKFAASDDRMRIKKYDDLHTGPRHDARVLLQVPAPDLVRRAVPRVRARQRARAALALRLNRLPRRR